MCAWVCGVSETGGNKEQEVQGTAKLIAVAGGLWVGPQASVKHMR